MPKLNFTKVAYCFIVVLLTWPVKAIKFDCSFVTNSMPIIGERYTCYAKVIDTGSAYLENVTGVHQTGRTNNDVGCLDIYNQNLSLIPERIVDFFGNLNALMIYRSLVSINADDLQPFPNLLFLYLYGNQLISLDGDLLKYTPHLQSLNFGGNRIRHIGNDLVSNLNSLEYLNFLDNICISAFAGTRDEVLSLGPQLSDFCPPLDAATTTSTTTETNECPCDEEIRELRVSNSNLVAQAEKQKKKIEQLELSNDQLMKENAELAERLLRNFTGTSYLKTIKNQERQ